MADKYIEDDLKEKCAHALIHHLTPSTACEMFDFARENNLVLLRSWCLQQFFPDRMNWSNLAKFIQYLGTQNNPEDEEDNKRLMNKAAKVILKDFAVVKHRFGTQAIFKVFEDCLIENISTKNIVQLTENSLGFFILQSKDKGETVWTNIGNAVLNFVFTNYQSLEEKGLVKRFSYIFLSYFKQYKTQRESALAQDGKMSVESKRSEGNEKVTNEEEVQRKAIKKMEPSCLIEVEEEEEDTDPILKKTKQPIDESRN